MRYVSFGLLLVPALAIGCKGKIEQSAPPPPEVEVAKPIARVIEEHEEFTGKTEAVDSVDIKPRATGYLEKVHFVDGAFVKKDDLLFEIDDREYKTSRNRAVASLAKAEADVKGLENDYRRGLESFMRKAISPQEFEKTVRDLDVARALVGVAKADLSTAEYNLGWCKVTAFVSGRISKRRVDPGSLVKKDETMLTNIVVTEPHMYASFDIDERTMLRLRNLRKQGRLLLSQDDEAVRTLAASTAGLLAEPPGPLVAGFGLYPGRAENKLPFKIGLADQDAFPIDGQLNFVDNKIDTGTGTLRVRGEFVNTAHKLHPGLFIRVKLPIGDPRPALLIAERALGTDQGQKFVYIVEKQPSKDDPSHYVDKVVYRQVKLGPLMEGGLRVIEPYVKDTDRETGIKAGELVIVSGLQRVRPKMVVTPKTEIMSGVSSSALKFGSK
jgi:RND family efflux transporter MFP subunit